jgi:endo-1,4-beta-D-glucanase Y
VTFNLSYFAPVAFRLFQMVDPAHDWNAVITANYNYMKTAQNLGVGLVPDWSDALLACTFS